MAGATAPLAWLTPPTLSLPLSQSVTFSSPAEAAEAAAVAAVAEAAAEAAGVSGEELPLRFPAGVYVCV